MSEILKENLCYYELTRKVQLAQQFEELKHIQTSSKFTYTMIYMLFTCRDFFIIFEIFPWSGHACDEGDQFSSEPWHRDRFNRGNGELIFSAKNALIKVKVFLTSTPRIGKWLLCLNFACKPFPLSGERTKEPWRTSLWSARKKENPPTCPGRVGVFFLFPMVLS